MSIQNGGESVFKRFLKENKSLAVSIPILVILLIAVIIIYFSMGSAKKTEAVTAAAESTSAPSQTIEILPNTERTINDSTSGNSSKNAESSSTTTIKDPFSGPLKLVGILVDSDGSGIAVIEANSTSYIVSKNDVLENNMTVTDISVDSVTLKNDDRELELKLEKRSDSQTVNK